jgi:hypothetical protein
MRYTDARGQGGRYLSAQLRRPQAALERQETRLRPPSSVRGLLGGDPDVPAGRHLKLAQDAGHVTLDRAAGDELLPG